jgi:PPOX class probable F420-dependent enzyme
MDRDASAMPDEAAAFVAARRVGRLATADERGRPHVVPVCYAFDGRRIYTAVDRKPKRRPARGLKRVLNVLANPNVALVVDDYSEDWTELAYVLVHGSAELLEDGEERTAAETLLRDKYPQYRELLDPGCAVIAITPTKTVAWGRAAAGAR